MLTIFLILGLLKLGYDQYQEDTLMKRIEEYETHWYEPEEIT